MQRFGLIAFICATLFTSSGATADIDRTRQFVHHVNAAIALLAEKQRNALLQITDTKRRHLAMTYYLRAGDTLPSRWSWDEATIEAYERSPEYAETLAEIDKVVKRFASDNRGYTLHAGTEIRSLEDQIERWETVRSVGNAATDLNQAMRKELRKDAYPELPDNASIKRFREFLIAWYPEYPTTVAAPGMSLHGRGRAYDFHIRDQRGNIVAGIDSGTIKSVWDGRGWTKKLSNAVHAASDKFVGPLQMPREPWHYEYRPKP